MLLHRLYGVLRHCLVASLQKLLRRSNLEPENPQPHCFQPTQKRRKPYETVQSVQTLSAGEVRQLLNRHRRGRLHPVQHEAGFTVQHARVFEQRVHDEATVVLVAWGAFVADSAGGTDIGA